MDRFNSLTANEQVYVHTDSEVYAPGDTIWFRAYIRNKASLKKTDLSRIFHLNLVNEHGRIVDNEKFVIINSQSSGQLVLGRSLEEGKYSLACYSSWMKNFNPEGVHLKKILVESEFTDGLRYVPHFDRRSYMPGDTARIIVKCYDKLNKPVEGSRFRYRLLLNEKVLDNGSGVSSDSEYPLSLIIPPGIAEIPELNIGDGLFEASYDVPVKAKMHVDFFPEGGHCLMNEMSNVAFKTVYMTGEPAAFSGDIVDEQGEVVFSVKSEHDGMGKFMYIPNPEGRSYLRINQPGGYVDLFELPEGKKDSWTIQAQSARNKIFVEVKNNLANFDSCLFMLSIRGYSYVYKLIPSESHASFSIPTDELPAGIAVLTLFNTEMLPQAERLIFVNRDRFISSVVSTENKAYLTRDSVGLHIDFSNKNIDFEKGQYSVSVYDDVFGGSSLINEPNIISSSYLSPEIRGNIHNPNYYFSTNNGLTAYHLDLLLLTQGWRAYNYLDKMIEIDSLKIPENQDLVRGNVKKIKSLRNPVPVEAELLVYFAGNSRKFPTDPQGNFSFYPEYTMDHTSSISVSAKDISGSDEVVLTIYDDEFRQDIGNHILESTDSTKKSTSGPAAVYEHLTRKLNINSRNSIWIDEVEVKGRNLEVDQSYDLGLIKSFTSTRTSPQSMLQPAFTIEDVLMSVGMYGNVVDGELMVYYRGQEVRALFVVDGVPEQTDYSTISARYPVEGLKNLYVATGQEALIAYGQTVVIYLEVDRDRYKQYLVDNTPNSRTIKEVTMTKEFYRPTYRTQKEREFPVPDIRKTIHWDPHVTVDSTGMADVSFYNSDRFTRVKCVLEGITDSGIPVYGETYYEITIHREKR